MRGLYLVHPHGQLIYSGDKTAILKSKPFSLQGDWVLVSKVSGRGRAYGIVTLGSPQRLSPAEADAQYEKHRVQRKDRLR